MGIFFEDLINLGNLIDTEVELGLPKSLLEDAFEGLSFELMDGLLVISFRKKRLFLEKTYQIRLSEEPQKVRTQKEEGKRYIFMRILSKDGLEELLKRKSFIEEDDFLGIDIWPAVKRMETYERVPKQFRERLYLSRYRVRNGSLSIFMKVSK
ncbi:MAG: hypothetical protein ACK4SM_02815 [Aquificaceae bacterium]